MKLYQFCKPYQKDDTLAIYFYELKLQKITPHFTKCIIASACFNLQRQSFVFQIP